MANTSGEKKSIDDGIVNTHDQDQILRGVQPKHQIAYKTYKACIYLLIIGLLLTVLFFGVTFVPMPVDFLQDIILSETYRKFVLICGAASIGIFLFGLLIKLLFLRKAPFDDWVYEIAEKRLGTSLIFYDSKHIYINYDRSGKEVDKREFVTEMSDKSVNYSYYYIKTYIDQGVIEVQCKKRQPIPNRASFSEKDDKFWNIIPMGLTINPNTQKCDKFNSQINKAIALSN